MPPNTNPYIMNRDDLSLFVDYYELTSGNVEFSNGNTNTITNTYFIRRIPEALGSYIVAAGLEQVADFIMHYKLSKADAEWLEETSSLSEDFLGYLSNFKFRGNIYAMEEGTVAFPNEPIISITGNSVDVQLFETYLLNMMNFQSLIATKTSRICNAANGRSIMEFGARRAHGRDAALLGVRAAYIGGASSTSLVLAGKKFGIPYVGTMPHKFVEEHMNEAEAFAKYFEAFPDHTTLLIDTYNIRSGAENACKVGKMMKERGHHLNAVRIDSGDLLALSKLVRRMLDAAGLKETKIVASSDLDEYVIEEMLKNGAPIDTFGVGTRLITGANYNPLANVGGVSALGGVYKLVEVERDGRAIPVAKISEDPHKATLPGRKQVYRKVKRGKFAFDLVTTWKEKAAGYSKLLRPIVIGGKPVYRFPRLDALQSRCALQMSMLPRKFKSIRKRYAYEVRLSRSLLALREKEYALIKERSN